MAVTARLRSIALWAPSPRFSRASQHKSPTLFCQGPHDAKEWAASLHSHSTKPQLSRWKSTTHSICRAKKKTQKVFTEVCLGRWLVTDRKCAIYRKTTQLCSLVPWLSELLCWSDVSGSLHSQVVEVVLLSSFSPYWKPCVQNKLKNILSLPGYS